VIYDQAAAQGELGQREQREPVDIFIPVVPTLNNDDYKNQVIIKDKNEN